MTKNSSLNLAAIDLGTNSFHLIIVAIDKKTGKFRILDREKEIVRLGLSSTDMKHLSPKAMSRGLQTLKRFKIIIEAHGAKTRAIATSAVREALNQKEFLEKAWNQAGIRIEIASGAEEARLIYLGVLQALPVYNKKTLLIDIGGGSTEFLVGLKRKIHYSNSLKLGAIRLTQRFFPEGAISSQSIKECRKFIVGTLNPVWRDIRDYRLDRVVGTSGTILNIAKMIHLIRNNRPLKSLNNFSFSIKELNLLVGQITQARNTKERSKISGLDKSRVDIIVAGALILEQIFKVLKINQMTVSEFALREGIILDTIEKSVREKFKHLSDIRYRSVLHLAEHFHYEAAHSHHVTQLALKIFDQTKSLHHLGNTEREYLETASLLHEIGFFISHSQHHHHSYYLIRNSELLGFTDNEKDIIAHIARYHRKSHPKLKHGTFNRLSIEEQQTVRKLASLLRIADGLDRTHSLAVRDIICKISGKKITFQILKLKKDSVDLEIWGAIAKSGLFEETFDLKTEFKLRKS